MSFRQKIKQVFHRPSTSPATPEPAQLISHSTPSFPTFAIKKTKTNATTKTTKEAQKREKKEKKEQKRREKRSNSKPKIELYKPYEIPPSKYRGPRDEAHQQRLNAYTFNTFNTMGSSARITQMSSPDLSPTATRAAPSRRGSDVSGKMESIQVDLVEDVTGTFLYISLFNHLWIAAASSAKC
jgi:hypothetical protein